MKMALGKQREPNKNIRVREQQRGKEEEVGGGEEDEISRTLSTTPIYAVMVLLYNTIHLSPSIQIIATD
jgi:hypothetical protein